MPHPSSSQRHVVYARIAGVTVAVGLHAAILAAIISTPPGKIEIDLPETVEVRFVEISDEVEDAAPNETPGEQPAVENAVDESVQEPQPEPLPEPEPVPEPETQPEPEPIPEPEPAPEPLPEAEPTPEPEPVPEPEPEPLPEPEPEAITEPPPPPVPEPPPPPKPEPPKPKPVPPKPVPPKPVPTRPKPAPPGSPAPSKPAAAAAESSAGPSGTETAAVPRAPSAPVDPDRPRVIGKVDYLGKRPQPEYPRMSQRRGEQGRVIVRVLISPEGRVLEAMVQKSSGYERLDEAAVRAVRSARFRPYTENGHAYRALADIPFDFVL